MTKTLLDETGTTDQDASSWPTWIENCFLIGCVCIGVACDWYCAFEWFLERSAVFSSTVVARMLLIVFSCASLGVLYVLLGKKRWELAIVTFFGASVNLSGLMLLSWVHR